MTYWVGVVIFGAVLLATGVLVVRALTSVQWAATAVVAIFFLVFAYQLGNVFLPQPAGALSARRHPVRASCREPSPSPSRASPA